MEDEELKLACHGTGLDGSIDKQIEIFSLAFPDSEKNMDDNAFEGLLFLPNNCPVGIVWLRRIVL
ncbi:DUF596 domain-containing protein [Kluyvera huaxiensis]|uniref:DUF596 domain-containing protein n=1 Tax=Kluyvera sp. 142053 TaxID=3160979 RepID=UPI0032E040D4